VASIRGPPGTHHLACPEWRGAAGGTLGGLFKLAACHRSAGGSVAGQASTGSGVQAACPHGRGLNGCDLLINGEERLRRASRRRVVSSRLALAIPPRGSSVSLAQGHWEPCSLGGDTPYTHIPVSAPRPSVPHCSVARHEQGPPSWLRSLGRGAVGGSCWVNPDGWAAFSGDLMLQGVASS